MEKEIIKKSVEQNTSEVKGNNWLVYSIIIGLILLLVGIIVFLFIVKDKFFGDSLPWIIMVVAVLLILGAVAAIMAVKGKSWPGPDYRAFFIMGLIWIIAGVPATFLHDYNLNGLFAMGIIFFVIGLVNKDKWKKRTWADLTPAEKKLKIWIIIILGILALAGAVAWFLTEYKLR